MTTEPATWSLEHLNAMLHYPHAEITQVDDARFMVKFRDLPSVVIFAEVTADFVCHCHPRGEKVA